MADSKLTNDQAKTLLQRLANDDAFRAAFTTDPRAALKAVGVDDQTITQLPKACLAQKSLASKDEYARILKEDLDSAVTAASQMTVPQVGRS
jgi:putative modified peptide